MLAQLQQNYPDDVRIVYRHLPLIGTPEQPFHDKAALSAQGADAAGAQGKFWEMHDLIFERQGDWTSLTPEEFQPWLVEQAGELGLDTAQFEQDMQDEENAGRIQAAWERGEAIGMVSTPFLLIDNQIWPSSLPMDYGNIEAILKLNLMEERQFTSCPPMTIDPAKQYFATLKTEKGDIVMELFADQAPVAVNNFIFLTRENWYDGVTFHRVLPGFVAQGGDPSGTGYGSPGYAFQNEIDPNLKFDQPGLLAMANAGPDSNGSQFFITLDTSEQIQRLNGGYTIFGRVVEGLEVVKSLTPRDPQQGLGLPPGDAILDIVIEER